MPAFESARPGRIVCILNSTATTMSNTSRMHHACLSRGMAEHPHASSPSQRLGIPDPSYLWASRRPCQRR